MIAIVNLRGGGGTAGALVLNPANPGVTVSASTSAVTSASTSPSTGQVSRPPTARTSAVASGASSTAGPASAAVAPGSQGTVVVYDAAGSPSLTTQAVTALTGAGYTVLRTRQVNYTLAQTTVFYDAGQAARAEALVAAKIGVGIARPRTSALANVGTLIVVVQRNYRP